MCVLRFYFCLGDTSRKKWMGPCWQLCHEGSLTGRWNRHSTERNPIKWSGETFHHEISAHLPKGRKISLCMQHDQLFVVMRTLPFWTLLRYILPSALFLLNVVCNKFFIPTSLIYLGKCLKGVKKMEGGRDVYATSQSVFKFAFSPTRRFFVCCCCDAVFGICLRKEKLKNSIDLLWDGKTIMEIFSELVICRNGNS